MKSVWTEVSGKGARRELCVGVASFLFERSQRHASAMFWDQTVALDQRVTLESRSPDAVLEAHDRSSLVFLSANGIAS